MKIMCDTNIILDVLLDREPFSESSCAVLELCESRQIEGFVSASAITDIFYIVRKYTHNADQAWFAVHKLLEIVNVCSVTEENIRSVLLKKAKDFEDCLVATCAGSIQCDYIVTRNQKDFAEFDIPSISPDVFLDYIRQQL